MSANLRQLYRRRLNVPGFKEGIRQSLYDFQTYDNAGHTGLTFFAVPRGQQGKTEADTNMELAGQLPAGQKFIIESVEIYIFPGSSASAYAVQDIVKSATALAAPNYANDVAKLGQSGFLKLKIGTKDYLQEGPLLRFPPKCGLLVQPAAAVENTNTTVLNQITADYARFVGRPYNLNPVLPILPNTKFEVVLGWPVNVATASGFDARIGVVLDGLLFRD